MISFDWLQRLSDAYLSRTRPADETLWHKWNTTKAVRLLSGERYHGIGTLWRRRTPNGWEFTADEETYDQFMDRQI